jgi:hypothetical protein
MTAIGILVTVTTTCAARLKRYSSSWAWMLWAVAAISGTTRMAGTTPMAKAPATMLTRYRAPAILASWRGEAPAVESINGLP